MPDPTLDQTTYSITKVPIFSTGTWHGKGYDRTDLDKIVSAFPYVGFRPPIKLGHSGSQDILKRSGFPSAGKVDQVYREGDTLFADFIDVPKQIHDLIERRAYDNVSVELYLNYDDTKAKKSYPFVLKAVALLGEEIPEVTHLDSITSLYHDADSGIDREFTVLDYQEEKAAQKDKVAKHKKEEVMPEDIKKLEEQLAESKKSLETMEQAMSKKDTEMKTMAESNKVLADAVKAQGEAFSKEKEARRRDKIKGQVKDFVSQKKITPAQAPFLETMMITIPQDQEVVVHLSKDGQISETKMSAEKAVESFVNATPKFIEKETLREGITDDLDNRIKAFCKENSLDYKTSEGYTAGLIGVTKQTGEKV